MPGMNAPRSERSVRNHECEGGANQDGRESERRVAAGGGAHLTARELSERCSKARARGRRFAGPHARRL